MRLLKSAARSFSVFLVCLVILNLFFVTLSHGARDKDQQVGKKSASTAAISKSKQTKSAPAADTHKQRQRQRAPEDDDQDDDDDEQDDDHDDDDDDQQQQQSSSKQQNKRLSDWLREQKQAKADVIELVSSDMLELMADQLNHLVVFFYDPSGQQAAKVKRILHELENIDDETDEHGIQFVKCDDVNYAKSIGIGSLPALVYFERHSAAPSIYSGDLEQEELVLEWLIEQKEEDTIENINRDILANLIAGQQQQQAKAKSGARRHQRQRDYLAVLFYKLQHDKSNQALEQLESIDDDLSEYNVHLVKLADDLMAKKYGVRQPPGLVLFRHGEPLKYPGELQDTKQLLNWLTLPENLETKHSIESVNEKMFQRFLKETQHLAILFHSEQASSCKQCPRVLDELETIDDELSELSVRFIKVDSQSLAKKYGVYALPALVYVTKDSRGQSQTTIYAGDLTKADEILAWVSEQKSPHLNEIPELSGKQCRDMIKSHEHVAIFVYDDDDDDDDDDEPGSSASVGKSNARDSPKEARGRDEDDEDGEQDDDDDDDDEEILSGLENIDSECRKHAIEFVKTSDLQFAREFGLDEQLPKLVYFEHGQASIYDGDLSAEEDLLDWLLAQKRDDTIEQVNRKLLERLIESSHYLVVLFQKSNCRTCQQVLETLEHIDDDCDAYGIHMVKINDMALAKRYGIKTFPALVYFRNGNPLIFAGDLKDEQQVLEWLLEDEQRELSDEIEDINGRMLEKLIDSSPFLAVLFYDDDCGHMCNKVLHELEKIDDDTDLYGIDFVKINDFQAARRHNVHSFPTLVYFRKQQASYYDGDLLDEEKVLAWLTSNDVFELEDEIEEVNKKMLDKLIETSDYIAVYFYEKNCKKCEDVLKELEHIDDEADSLDIMFVKIRDMNYAKKFGITQAPSLVYFRKKFPSIYRGDLMKEEKVLEWLRKNRYRNPELNLFMYALFAITISFVLYTMFLMFFVKKKQD